MKKVMKLTPFLILNRGKTMEKLFLLFTLFIWVDALEINVDLASRGRMFEGIGAISGGGGHARMLPLYPEPQRSEILDYLFKPKFGASLQIFKVEIGGDDQTTQGTESSHRHYEWEDKGNFNRGYEFWMIKEAKKRNPNIKLAALPWSWPGWLGNGKNPFLPINNLTRTAEYVISYILGVKREFGYDIEEVGVWNEKPDYVPYIKALYNQLKLNGLEKKVKLVAGDNHWEIIDTILADQELKSMITKVGVHYPGEFSPDKARNLPISLCSSEDDSTDAWLTKAGCLARILNRNYVTGLFTSTIIYNAISAFYDDLSFPRTGLLTANQPWGGWYNVDSPIWLTAHTTQFTQIGWWYLAHNSGVGKLDEGGSYVTLVSPDGQFFAIVIETMDWSQSACVRPPMPPYKSWTTQNVTFKLKNWKFSTPPKLYVRQSDLPNNDIFAQKPAIQVGSDFKFTIAISPNQVITLSNAFPGNKGSFSTSQLPRKDFPFPYTDNFESTPIDQEGRYWQQQIGVFEVVASSDPGHGRVLQQMILQPPVTWCFPNTRPLAVLGNYNWTDHSFAADIKIPAVNGSSGAFIAAHVKHGGCFTLVTPGIFVWASPQDNTVYVQDRMTVSNATCKVPFAFNKLPGGANSWFNLAYSFRGDKVWVYVNGKKLISACQMTGPSEDRKNGFVGIGTRDYSFAQFDNIKLDVPFKEDLLNY